jgi:hypothetical protein
MNVAGPFCGVEAAALPGGRDSENLQLGGADLGAAAVLEDDALVGSCSGQVSGRGDEGQQQPRVTGGRVRVEGPDGQLGTDELLCFDLSAHGRVRAGERGQQATVAGSRRGRCRPLGITVPVSTRSVCIAKIQGDGYICRHQDNHTVIRHAKRAARALNACIIRMHLRKDRWQ